MLEYLYRAVGLTIWFEIFTLNLYSTHFGWAILSTIFCVAAIGALVKSCAIYSVVAFTTASKYNLDRTMERAVDALENKLEEVAQNAGIYEAEQTQEPKQEKKQHK